MKILDRRIRNTFDQVSLVAVARRWNKGRARASGVIIALLITGWLLLNAWQGLFAYFSPDDVMNMYWAWTEPVRKLVLANFFPFSSSSYRPLGAAVYRVGLFFFGFSPLPFRIVIYALVLFNAWLVFRLAKRLTGSVEIGVLAAFFMSFHQRLVDVYTNTGTVYDVLCCTFYALALLYYIHVRERGYFKPIQCLWLYLLVVATINSKEMGVTLPIMLLGYEILYRPVLPTPPRGLLRGAIAAFGPVLMSAAVVVLAMKRKLGGGSHFVNNEYYKLHLSLTYALTTTRKLFDNLFWQTEDTFTTAGVIAVACAVLGIALLARRRHLWFCALFMLAGPLPVDFIVPRSLFSIYVVLMAWCIFAASVLVEGRDWLYTRVWKRPALPPATWEPERVFLCLVIAILLWTVHVHDRPVDWAVFSAQKNPIYELKTGIERLHPNITPASRILFLDDRFTNDDWIPILLVRTLYHNPQLVIDRAKWMAHKPQGVELASYTHVFDYRDNRLVEVK